MEEKKPIYCALAFGSASINSYGEYIPCCNIRTTPWKNVKDSTHSMMLSAPPQVRINADNLKEVRRSLINGDWPEVCANCKEAEDAGVGSMRMIWNRGLEHCNIPATEHVDPNNIRYLDLTFSTKCNSKCMTCNIDLSEFWTEEWNKIWRIKPSEQKKINRICISENNSIRLVNDFPNVEKVALIGGEPTISEEHVFFLEKLITEGKSKNVSINYVTNLTGITDELIDMWKQFKAVHLSVSIDGYDKVNEYIRYPFKWKKIETNLNTILAMVQNSVNRSITEEGKNDTRFSLGLSCTLSLFNAIQAPDLFRFWYNTLKEYKTPFNNRSLIHDCGCFVNRVTHPDYALVNLLSLDYRQKGIDKIDLLLSDIQKDINADEDHSVNNGFLESLRLVKTWLTESQVVNSVYLSQNKHFIKESDQNRGRKLVDFIPELQVELDKVWHEGIIPGDWYLDGITKIY